ncbi:MAG: hypothetical protein QM831_16650 [Kofleriaceae bacterium]
MYTKTVLIAAALSLGASPPGVPPLVGATEVQSFGPSFGYVDDPVASDDGHLAYVLSDGTTKSELHIVPATGAEQVIDISAFTLHPIGVKLFGAKTFITAQEDNGDEAGAMFDKAKLVYKVGPATHVTLINRDGKDRIALDRVTGTKHEVEIDALDNGKRIAAGKPFELDAQGAYKPLEFHVNHWSDGWTKAYGIKGGEWDRKENQRSPDAEAVYDLVTGKLGDKKPITDLFEQHKRFQTLADSNGSIDFVKFSWDNTSLVAWKKGIGQPIELDQALGQYDPKSLQYTPDVTWLALKVDPVNPEAVARKKADPEYFDVFKIDGTKAVRKMRILATNTRLRFGIYKDKVWILERSSGFDRGGKALTVYSINN